MSYLASQHTTVSKPIGITGNSVDARTRYYDATVFRYRDYVSTQEVLDYLDTVAKRQSAIVFVNSTGTLSNGTITGGERVIWWFKNGTNNGDLVKFFPDVVASYNDLTDKPNLSTVATSGNYNDLSNKPTLATVASSGSYTDLTNKPSLPNQSLNTTDSPTFSGIEVNGGQSTKFIKSVGAEYGSALYVETYGPANAVTPVINFGTRASSDNSLYLLNIQYQTPPSGYGLEDSSPTVLTIRRTLGGTVAYLEEVALKVQETDIEITNATKGIILKSPDGSRFRITVTDAGTLTTTEL